MFKHRSFLILQLFLRFLRECTFPEAIGHGPLGYLLYLLQQNPIGSLNLRVFLLLDHVLLLLVEAHLRVVVVIPEKPLLQLLPLLLHGETDAPVVVNRLL
jgi:hypothetical protein